MAPSPDHLEAVTRAVNDLEAARQELRRAIGAARDAGHTQRAIAQAAGMSQGKVWRVLRGE